MSFLGSGSGCWQGRPSLASPGGLDGLDIASAHRLTTLHSTAPNCRLLRLLKRRLDPPSHDLCRLFCCVLARYPLPFTSTLPRQTLASDSTPSPIAPPFRIPIISTPPALDTRHLPSCLSPAHCCDDDEAPVSAACEACCCSCPPWRIASRASCRRSTFTATTQMLHMRQLLPVTRRCRSARQMMRLPSPTRSASWSWSWTHRRRAAPAATCPVALACLRSCGSTFSPFVRLQISVD